MLSTLALISVNILCLSLLFTGQWRRGWLALLKTLHSLHMPGSLCWWWSALMPRTPVLNLKLSCIALNVPLSEARYSGHGTPPFTKLYINIDWQSCFSFPLYQKEYLYHAFADSLKAGILSKSAFVSMWSIRLDSNIRFIFSIYLNGTSIWFWWRFSNSLKITLVRWLLFI